MMDDQEFNDIIEGKGIKESPDIKKNKMEFGNTLSDSILKKAGIIKTVEKVTMPDNKLNHLLEFILRLFYGK